MSVRRIGLGSLIILCLGSTVLADYAVVSAKSDFEPRLALFSSANPYDPGPSGTATSVRVGVSGGASNRVYGNSAFMFQLPVLAPGETITGATLRLAELVDASAGTPAANVDIWAIGFDNNNPPLNSAAESQAYFFNGSNDAGAGFGTGAARMKIQEDFLLPGDVVLSGSPVTHTTSASGNASLLAYIQSLYANPNVIPGTSNLLLRLNYDNDTYAPTTATTANRFTLGSADNATASNQPLLTLTTTQVPEPATMGILAGTVLMLNVRRRKGNF
jgi:hypothetical protein